MFPQVPTAISVEIRNLSSFRNLILVQLIEDVLSATIVIFIKGTNFFIGIHIEVVFCGSIKN